MAKKKKDFNYPEEDAPEHTTSDFFTEPFKRFNKSNNVDLLTPEKRKERDDKERTRRVLARVPPPNTERDNAYKRKVTGERAQDIDLSDDVGIVGLHKKWGKAAGLDHKKVTDLDEAETNKIFEYDQRGGSFFKDDDDSTSVEIKITPKRKKSIASY